MSWRTAAFSASKSLLLMDRAAWAKSYSAATVSRITDRRSFRYSR